MASKSPRPAASDRVGLWFEDWMNQRAVRRMIHRRRYPPTIERPYWHNGAFAKDSARLEALGYSVTSETDNAAYLSSTLPANTGGGFGQLSRTVSRRVPSIHVVYHRPAV